ncbi:hypothetical protein K2Y11_19770 [bacterium]|nr:hypothetical protein [bacterium]
MSRVGSLIAALCCAILLNGCSPSTADLGVSLETPTTDPVSSKIDGQDWPMKVGQPFPDVAFTSADGQPWRLSSLKGKVVVFLSMEMGDSNSVAVAGAKEAGMFEITSTNLDVPSLEEGARQKLPGFTFEDPRIVVVELILHNRAGFTPNAEEVKKWSDHFKPVRRGEVITVGATDAMVGRSSVSALPGMYVIDQEGIVRFGFSNERKSEANEAALFHEVIRLCDPAPKDLPTLTSEESKLVADTFEKEKVTPLKLAKGKKEEEEFEPALLEFQKTTFLNQFKPTGGSSNIWRQKALAVINTVSRRQLRLPSGSDLESIRAYGSQALREGCEDPVFRICYAQQLLEDGLIAEAETNARAAVKTLDADPDSYLLNRFRARQLLATAILRGKDFSVGRMKEANDTAKEAIVNFAAACAVPMTDGYTQEFLAEEMNLNFNQPNPFLLHIWGLADAIQKQQGVDPWLVDIILAKCCLAAAAREQVSPPGKEASSAESEIASKYNKAASGYLVRAWTKRPENPLAARMLMNHVAATEPVAGETVRFWFDQVVRDRFDDRNAFTDMLALLRSSKEDKTKELVAFGIEGVDSGRFDSTVPFLLLEVVVALAKKYKDRGQDPTIAFQLEGVKESVPRLYEGYLKLSTLSDANRRNIAVDYVLILFQSGDVEAARREFIKINEKIPDQRFNTYLVDKNKFMEAMKGKR